MGKKRKIWIAFLWFSFVIAKIIFSFCWFWKLFRAIKNLFLNICPEFILVIVRGVNLIESTLSLLGAEVPALALVFQESHAVSQRALGGKDKCLHSQSLQAFIALGLHLPPHLAHYLLGGASWLHWAFVLTPFLICQYALELGRINAQNVDGRMFRVCGLWILYIF